MRLGVHITRFDHHDGPAALGPELTAAGAAAEEADISRLSVMTWINHANAVACDDRAPFGGFRQSGIGREMGPDGLLSFTEAHTITTHG